jgi:hypothetical protein
MGAKDVLHWLFFVFIILPLLVFIIIPLLATLLFLLPSLFFMGEMWFLSKFIWPLNLPPVLNFIILLSAFVAPGVFFLKMLDLLPSSSSSSSARALDTSWRSRESEGFNRWGREETLSSSDKLPAEVWAEKWLEENEEERRRFWNDWYERRERETRGGETG